MSGNSPRRRLTTSPMRIRCSRLGAVALMPAPGAGKAAASAPSMLRQAYASSLDEGQPVLADLELVAVRELHLVDPPAVDERAVERALVLDRERAVAVDEHGVVAGD